jgi:hypothetical protein
VHGGSLWPKAFWTARSGGKLEAMVFCDMAGILMVVWLPQWTTVSSVVYCSIKTSWHRKCWCCMAIPGLCTCRQTTWSLVFLGSVLCHIFTRFYLIRLWPVWQGEGSIEQLLIPWPWWLAERLQVNAYCPVWLVCCIHQTVARMRAEVHWH